MPRVLVADDQEEMCTLLRLTLEFNGFDVYSVTNGEECLAKIPVVNPDLVILDVMMPGRYDGLQVLEQIRKTSDVKVIITSARAQQADKARGLEAGADLYVTKPFSPLKLVEQVKAVLNGGEASFQPC